MSLTDRQMNENDFTKADRWKDCIHIFCSFQQPRNINILHSNNTSSAYAYQTQNISIIYKHLYAKYFTDKRVHQEKARCVKTLRSGSKKFDL